MRTRPASRVCVPGVLLAGLCLLSVGCGRLGFALVDDGATDLGIAADAGVSDAGSVDLGPEVDGGPPSDAGAADRISSDPRLSESMGPMCIW